MVILGDIPNPVDAVGSAIGDAVGGAASKAAEATFNFFMKRFADALANAATKVVTELLHYLDTSSGVSLDQGWFAGPRAHDILSSVALFAGTLMVAFLLGAVIQGLLNGDATMMLRAAVAEAPLSVFGIVALTTITAALLAITDAASSMVLAGAPENLGRYLNFGHASSILSVGLLGPVLLIVFIVAAILVWIELVIRSSLIYLLLAFAPVLLAARVWPVLRGGWHQLCRIGMALIVSKFAICLALGLGAAALAGGGPGNLGAAGPNPNDVGTQTGLTVAGLMVGASLMLLGAVAPFVILKLLPVFEAAVLAQGISRSPMRAAQSGMQSAFYADRLASGKLFNGSGGASANGGAGPGGGSTAPSGAAGSGGTAGGAPGASMGGGPASGPAAGAGAAGSAARGTGVGAAGSGAGGTGDGAGGATAGGASAGPAAVAMVPLALASSGVAKAKASATAAADAVSGSSSPSKEGSS